MTRWVLALLLVGATGGWCGALGNQLLAAAGGTPAPATAFADVQPTDQIGGVALSDQGDIDAPDISAPSALVATGDGQILWERGGDIQRPMASTTKIMTAVVALENFNLDAECVVTRGAAATGGTSAGLRQGDVLPMRDLLVCLLLPSGNDAAVTIAENVAGTEANFVAMMNQKAVDLGMNNTHYIDASGLSEDGLYSTVRDYLILARYAMRNDTFRSIVAMQTATVTITGREVNYTSTNKLFDMMDGVIGIKTGTNYEADSCLVACVVHNGLTFYSIIFGAALDTDRYNDTVTLMNWAFRHYRVVELANATTVAADLALTDWIDQRVGVRVAWPVNISVFDLAGPIQQEVDLTDWSGAINKGDKVGRVVWSQNGEVLATADLVADQSVAAPDFWQRLGIGWQRFWGGFSGQPRQATTEIYLPDVLELPAADVPAAPPAAEGSSS